MGVSNNLERLIEAAAPYWAGEAEVFTTYWDWGGRTRETDRRWLMLQCSKEIWGSGLAPLDKGIFLGPAEELIAAFPKIDTEIDRHAVLDIAEGLWAEFAHYCAFADAHDALALPDEPKINPQAVKIAWPEDLALATLRLKHRESNPKLGKRATSFTEGGYCTLFSEGMKLKERTSGRHGRANALIAEACAKVYEDEFGHMLKGIVGLDAEGLSAAEWTLLEEMSVDQLRHRIVMRNAQFSYPLAETRLKELMDGKARPLAFDYEKAALAA
ncbi:MAG TPA: hypothetical protein VJ924_02785 [Alphaproteobacteria bacterium]|nr:hypothetical protein [Alphaproteobacteria bacterium]